MDFDYWFSSLIHHSPALSLYHRHYHFIIRRKSDNSMGASILLLPPEPALSEGKLPYNSKEKT